MADVERDRVAAQPLETAHAEVGALQRFGGRLAVLVRPGEDDVDGAGQEDQLPPGRSTRAASGSRRKDHTRCWHRIRKSPGRRRHRPAVSAPRWRGSAGSPARSDLARRRPAPAARRSYPGRPAGRRGGPARLKHTRCRSPAPGCPRRPAPAARSPAVLQGPSTLPILVPWPPSCAGPDRRSQRPAGPRPPGCAAHDQALQSHPQRLRRRPARQPPHRPLAIRGQLHRDRAAAEQVAGGGAPGT